MISSIWLGVLGVMACGGGDDGDALVPNTPDVPEQPIEWVVTVHPSVVEATATENTYEVKVTTTGKSWKAVTADRWLNLTTEHTESKEGVIKVTVEPNEEAERYGRIVVSSGTKNEYVQVKQQGGLRLSQSEATCGSSAGVLEVTVYESSDWKVTSDQDWAAVSRKDNRLLVNYAENKALSNRTAIITVAGSGQERTLSVTQESAEDTQINTPEGYTLVWHDEFNEGAGLSDHWRHEEWKPEHVNHELQYYVKEQSPSGRRVTELADGKLSIHRLKENGNIYSGRVNASEHTGWQYGYIEARILLPKGKGTWPAFWMMPCNVDWAKEGWPYCGEIDIMEEVGVDANQVSSSLHASGHNHTNNTQVTHAMYLENAEGAYHVYALKWTPEQITTYVDGQVQLVYKNPNTASTVDPKWNWPYDRPYYVILNLAWGGDWGGYKGVDESALPATMKVDYVRVFQKK